MYQAPARPWEPRARGWRGRRALQTVQPARGGEGVQRRELGAGVAAGQGRLLR